MTTKRLLVLLAFIAVGFSAVLFLPKSAAQPFGIRLQLNEEIGDWHGKDEEITEKEVSTLGKGTEFARKRYTNPDLRRAPGYNVLTSIVLSGHDMSQSIHRPERCLTAQGWTTLESLTVPVEVKDKGKFKVTRLHNTRMAKFEDGSTGSLDAYTYYWFAGERQLVATHWDRWYTDNKDRLLRGVNQRWAFITVTGVIPRQKTPEMQAEADKFVDETLRGFIAELAPTIHLDSLKYD